jgi:glutamate 5-kinase
MGQRKQSAGETVVQQESRNGLELPSAVSKGRERNEWQKQLTSARRLVIKLGTGIVTNEAGGFSDGRIGPIVSALASLKQEGRQIVLVSSGAVGLGAGHLGLSTTRLKDLVTRQACAAVGQSLLMHEYEQLFRIQGIKIAQVLLTESDFSDWSRYQNLRQTMERLLKLDVLPVINENDTVSIAELESIAAGGQRVFSDNDRLAALVMSKLDAEVLVLLTNVDGLLANAPEGKDVAASHVIPFVSDITPELKSLASGPTTRGRGGMITKLEAAQIAVSSGFCVIANGANPNTLTDIFAGKPNGTLFVSPSRMPGKRRWIAFATNVRGRLAVNDGAREAILRGKGSLLASGVIQVRDQFAARDVVSIVDSKGQEFARGIVNCNSNEALKLIQSSDKKRQRARDHVLVTRDNIVLNPA